MTAADSSNAWISRKSNSSAPGTMVDDQVVPPSVVRKTVPEEPLDQMTLSLKTCNPRRLASTPDDCICHGEVLFGFSSRAELCNYNGSQGEMNQCAALEYAQADAFLNVVWKNLKKCLGSSSPAYQQVLNGQRNWIQTKESNCESEANADWGEGEFRGSGWNLGYYGCLTRVTHDRVKFLLDRYDICTLY